MSTIVELTLSFPIPIVMALSDPPPQPRPEEPSDGNPGEDWDDFSTDDAPDGAPVADEADWEVFIPDELERDPLPEPGDFWPPSDSPWD